MADLFDMHLWFVIKDQKYLKVYFGRVMEERLNRALSFWSRIKEKTYRAAKAPYPQNIISSRTTRYEGILLHTNCLISVAETVGLRQAS